MSLYSETTFPGKSEKELEILSKLNDLIDFKNLSFKEKLKAYNKMINHCRNCTFHSIPVPSLLRENSKYIFVGKTPFSNVSIEDELTSPTNKASKLFNIYLHCLGISKEDISYINLTHCTGNNYHTPTTEELKTCAQYKATEFEIVGDNYKVIFLMGDDVVKWFLDNMMIQQAIGKMFCYQRCNGEHISVIPIYQPYHMLKVPQLLKSHLDYLKSLRRNKIFK